MPTHLDFHYRYIDAEQGRLRPVVLLHGSGRDEDDLVSFGRAIASANPIYALRGQVPWDNGFAFFRRNPDRTVDHDDLRHRAENLCCFLHHVCEETKQRPLLIGYSNGAIIAAETVFQHPELSWGAILMRPLSPRSDEHFPQLTEYKALILAADKDDRRDPSDAPNFAQHLSDAGSDVHFVTLDAAGPRTTWTSLPRRPGSKIQTFTISELPPQFRASALLPAMCARNRTCRGDGRGGRVRLSRLTRPLRMPPAGRR